MAVADEPGDAVAVHMDVADDVASAVRMACHPVVQDIRRSYLMDGYSWAGSEIKVTGTWLTVMTLSDV